MFILGHATRAAVWRIEPGIPDNRHSQQRVLNSYWNLEFQCLEYISYTAMVVEEEII